MNNKDNFNVNSPFEGIDDSAQTVIYLEAFSRIERKGTESVEKESLPQNNDKHYDEYDDYSDYNDYIEEDFDKNDFFSTHGNDAPAQPQVYPLAGTAPYSQEVRTNPIVLSGQPIQENITPQAYPLAEVYLMHRKYKL